jgi:hypothetical protein
LTPDRVDPFAKTGGNVDHEGNTRTSYKDVLINIQLDREKQEVIQKIRKKEREKKEQQKQEEEERKAKKIAISKKAAWSLAVFKNNQQIGEYPLNEEITHRVGREEVMLFRSQPNSCRLQKFEWTTQVAARNMQNLYFRKMGNLIPIEIGLIGTDGVSSI